MMLNPGSSAQQYAEKMTQEQKIWVIRSLFVFQYNTRRLYPIDRCSDLFDLLVQKAGHPGDGTVVSNAFGDLVHQRNLRLCPRSFPRTSDVLMRKLFIDRCRMSIECRVGEISSTGKHISLG